jgi:type IV fimbrial biogenesis protein FimT
MVSHADHICDHGRYRHALVGFTLVEVMVVIAIMGVVLAIAAPSLSELVKSQRTGSAASKIYSSLALARSEAIKRNASVTLARSGVDWASGWTMTTGGTTLQTEGAIADTTIDLKLNGTSAASLSYNAAGRLPSTTSSAYFILYVTSDTTIRARCVTINLAGTASVKSDSDDNKTNGC